jgi:transposase
VRNGKRGRYTLEFKQEAVRLVESDQTMAAAVRSLRDLGINSSGGISRTGGAMFDHATKTFSGKEKIEILLKEYDTLRAEIVGRTTGGYQLIGVQAIIFTAALGWRSQHGVGEIFWFFMGVLVVLGLLFGGSTYRDISMLARRVREIEEEINNTVGENLLRWETEFGGLNGILWITRRRRMRVAHSGRLSRPFQQFLKNIDAPVDQDILRAAEPTNDSKKHQLDMHVAEYCALSTRHVYSLMLQYSVWAGVAVYWAFLVTLYQRVPAGWIAWAAIFGLEMAATGWYFNLADLYTNVCYMQTRLRPQVQEIIGIEDVWGYESFLIERRGHEKAYGDAWALVFALLTLMACWFEYPPRGWQWGAAIVSSGIMVWVGFLTWSVLALRRQWD